MSRLLRHDSQEDSTDDGFGAKTIRVRDLTFCNSATKFWSHLVDELLHDFSCCDTVVLMAPFTAPLTRTMMHPELGLQAALENLGESELSLQWCEVLAEINLLGAPIGVTIQLLDGDKGRPYTEPLLLESVDSEVFPFLVVWLLQWAGISENAWANGRIHGQFRAEDPDRGWVYDLTFSLCHTHLHEGLYQRSISLQYQRWARTDPEKI